MKYSKKDYNYLLVLKERVSRAKGNYVNSFEIYVNYQLMLISKYGMISDELAKNHYLEWEKVSHLFHTYLLARKCLTRAFTDLHLFREYLVSEYSEKEEGDF